MMNKPVSLYIHIPFCKSKCPYCDFYSARPEEDDVFDRYLAALCARLAVYGEKYGERLLHTVYFGGGGCHIADSVSYDGFICVPADGDI